MDLAQYKFLQDYQDREAPQLKGETFNIVAVCGGYRQACMFQSHRNHELLQQSLWGLIENFHLSDEVGTIVQNGLGTTPIHNETPEVSGEIATSSNSCCSFIVYNKSLVGESVIHDLLFQWRHLSVLEDLGQAKAIDHKNLTGLIGLLLGYQTPNHHLYQLPHTGNHTRYRISYSVGTTTEEASLQEFHSEIICDDHSPKKRMVEFNLCLDRQLSEYNHLAQQLGLEVILTKKTLLGEHDICDILQDGDCFTCLEGRNDIANYFRNYSFLQTSEKIQALESYSDTVEALERYKTAWFILAQWVAKDPFTPLCPLTQTSQTIVKGQTERLENLIYSSTPQALEVFLPSTLQRYSGITYGMIMSH